LLSSCQFQKLVKCAAYIGLGANCVVNVIDMVILFELDVKKKNEMYSQNYHQDLNVLTRQLLNGVK